MRVLLANGHRLFREAVAALLEYGSDGFDLATAADFGGALEVIGRQPPFDAILFDYDMQRADGQEIAEIRTQAPTANLGIISATRCDDDLFRFVSASGISFLPKTLPARDFIEAIKLISNGGHYLPQDASRLEDAPTPPGLSRLTGRERDVLNLLREGPSNKQIANLLGIEEVTVRLHLRGIFRKLGAKNRVQAVAKVITLTQSTHAQSADREKLIDFP